LSNDADFDRVDSERAASDAILVGANTIRRDNRRLLVRSEPPQPERARHGLPPSPAKVTITATGDLDPGKSFFTAGGPEVARLVYCPTPAVAPVTGRLVPSPGLELIGAGEPVDLAGVLADLSKRGVRRLFAEGGTTIHT